MTTATLCAVSWNPAIYNDPLDTDAVPGYPSRDSKAYTTSAIQRLDAGGVIGLFEVAGEAVWHSSSQVRRRGAAVEEFAP